MLQMIFEKRGDGTPAPRMPRKGDGTPRTPDGVRYFDLAGAGVEFQMSEDELRERYLDAFQDVLQEAPDAEAAPLPALAVDPARVQAGRIDLLRMFKFPTLTDPEIEYVCEVCRRRGLDAWLHVHAEVKVDRQTGRREVLIITRIDAFRTIAAKTGQYDGYTLPEYQAADGTWHTEVWPADKGFPVAAKVHVRRKDFTQPQPGVAEWNRYVRYVDTPRGLEVSEAWVTGGAQMLAKCALAQAFRGAFPELQQLYLSEEMEQAANPAPHVPAPTHARGGGRGPAVPAAAAHVEADPDDVVFDETTPETPAEFAAALEGFGFKTDQARAAVVFRLRKTIPFPPTSRTFYAAAVKRLRERPDLYGATAA